MRLYRMVFPTYAKYDEVHAQALATSSPEHNLNTNWIMLDAVKNRSSQRLDPINPKCINDFINKGGRSKKRNSSKKYSVNCNNHTWVIKQGDIVAHMPAKTNRSLTMPTFYLYCKTLGLGVKCRCLLIDIPFPIFWNDPSTLEPLNIQSAM